MRFRTHVAALVLTIAALLATAADDKRLSIYGPQTSFSVNAVEREGNPYVPLLDVLSRFGSTSARAEGNKWKLKFNDTESEFKARKTKVKVNRKEVTLAAPFLLQEGRALVPLSSLGAVLSRLLPGPVEVKAAARRVFIGGAATRYRAEFQAGGPRLVLHFSAPVNPSIATEPGRLRMTFEREPLVGTPVPETFNDKTIRSIAFSEHDGVAELVVDSGAPLLATFGEQDRTLTLAPAPQAKAPTAATQTAAPTPPAPAAAEPGPATAAPEAAAPVARARATVVIDPGHGGDDRGAALSESLAEKDVTLAWAKRLRAILEQKGIPATLLREGDVSLTLDQRAALANAARPLVFISLHAGTTGTGVHLYTAHLPEAGPRPASFLPWNSAQSAYLDGSRAVAGSVAAEVSKLSIPVGTAPVLLRPLNSIATAAIAIEVMPPAADIAGLMSAGYQQSLCGAIADGIAAVIKPAPHPNPAGAAR